MGLGLSDTCHRSSVGSFFRSTSVAALLIIAILASIASCGGSTGLEPEQQDDTGVVKQAAASDRYVVCLKPGATDLELSGLTAALENRPRHTYRNVFRGFAARLLPAELASIRANPLVEFVEPDGIATIADKPPKPPKPDPPPAPEEVIPWGISKIGADLCDYTGAGIGVAVVDTGIDLDHPDLPNAVHGYNALNERKLANDDHGHGTHVAGIVGAADNTIGVVGVAPECTLVAVKVLNRKGFGYYSDIAAGIDWVTAHKDDHMNDATGAYKIRVINYSVSGSGPILREAMEGATLAGISISCAAENDSRIAVKFEFVFTVSAMDPDGTFAWYSNYGPEIDFIAPGTAVLSTLPGGDYGTMSGTSMATPHVAGAAALWISVNPPELGGNPVDFWDVLAGLQSIAVPAPEDGWPEDPDAPAYNEPLVHVANLAPVSGS